MNAPGTGSRRPRAVLAATVGFALAAPSSAAAHGPPAPDTGALAPAERERVAAETPLLGREHALQHVAAARQSTTGQAADRRTLVCGPRPPAVVVDVGSGPPLGRPTGQARCAPLPRQPRGAALRREGRWEGAALDLPHYAIHATLLPTGKVLFFGYGWTRSVITKEGAQIEGRATLWDPRRGTGPQSMKAIPPPRVDLDGDGVATPTPLYCAGQTLLADGSVLVVGGMLDGDFQAKGYAQPPGHRVVVRFDPRTERWARGPDTSVGRWYPTLAKLGDGRVLALGGFDDTRATTLTPRLEVLGRTGRTVRREPAGDRLTMLYPGLVPMPSGRVLLAGPWPGDSALLDPATWRWRDLAPLPGGIRTGANVVPLPSRSGSSPRVEILGGSDADSYFDRRTSAPARRSTLVLDERRAEGGWRAGPQLRRPRHYGNTVLLPDGGSVMVGGGAGITPQDGNYTPGTDTRRVELRDERTGRWRLGPAQREDRTYHSVALLLPDGRVWSAGDDANPTRDGDTGEVYAPPYLFRGPRPRVTRAPRVVRPRARLRLTGSGPPPRRVTLVAPGATTHGLDMHQRHVELRGLRVRRIGARWSATVAAPRSTRVAPPGPWMLFALSERGVPSTAAWTTVR